MSTKLSVPEGTPEFTNFEDFWRHYVTQHQHPGNQLLHVAGTLGAVACLGLSVYRSWLWLGALLPVGYGLAWVGHFLIERNRPLTLTYPGWSLRADYRLVIRLVSRRPLITPAIALYREEACIGGDEIRRQDHADDLSKGMNPRVFSGEQTSMSSRVR